jgi:hypothetical protein
MGAVNAVNRVRKILAKKPELRTSNDLNLLACKMNVDVDTLLDFTTFFWTDFHPNVVCCAIKHISSCLYDSRCGPRVTNLTPPARE